MKRALFAVAFLVVSSAAFASPREALLQFDYDRLIREVEAMQSPTAEARALMVYALTRSGASTQAAAIAKEMREQHPGDPWSWYATLAASRPGENADAGATMLRLAGEQPDEEMVRLQAISLATNGSQKEALALIDRQTRTPRMILARATVLRTRVRELPDEVAQLADEVLAMIPDHIEAIAMRGSYDVERGRAADAVKLYQRVLDTSSSINLHRHYWLALRKDNTLTPEQRQQLLDADIKRLVQQRGETPAVLFAIAEHHNESGDAEKGRAYGDRVLREAPSSREATRVLQSRLYEEEETDEARARMRQAAQTILTWPHPIEELTKAQAHQLLFIEKRDDLAISGEELLRHAEGMKMLADRQPAVVFAQTALALADRGVLLAEAERYARDGIAAAGPHFAERRKRMFGDPADIQRNIDAQRAVFHEALGWVLFQRGRFPEAEQELRTAWKLGPHNHTTAHRLGRFLESQRLYDEAEEIYRIGMSLPSPGTNKNGDALRALYEKRHGSLDGWDSYLATARNAEASERRATILKERIRDRAVPAFTLKTLEGKILRTADLKGKIAVINFWGIWCGWCVKEMPDYQKLAEKYANDERVLILTINNDDSAEKVKKWMAEKKYAFPVLLDDAFVIQHIRVFPTTWFIDESGQLAFEKKGWSEKLVEEFSWRIEALR